MNRILRNAPDDPCGMDTVDEVVVANCHVHLEQLDLGAYWIGITLNDGTPVCDITLTTPRATIRCRVEEAPGWTWDQDKTHS